MPVRKDIQSKIYNLKAKIDWLILLLLIFVPRLLNLNIFLTADEPLFLKHAREFGGGLTGGDFSRTLGIGYPGVTVAWWSAPVVGLSSTELGAYTAGRLATAMASGVLLLILFALARLLVGRGPALLGVGLLALDPYTLSYSRLLHIAAPLALFMTLAGVSLLLWLRSGRNQLPQSSPAAPRAVGIFFSELQRNSDLLGEKDPLDVNKFVGAGYCWLLLAGLFTGLALLTKSTGLLLGPMLGAMVVGWATAAGQWKDGRWWLLQLAGLMVVASIASITFMALWPAMWSMPSQALTLTFGKLFRDQEAGTGNLGLFWLGHFVEDPGPAFYPVTFLLKSTPWLLIGLVISLWLMLPSVRSAYFVLRRTLYPSPARLKPASAITNRQFPISLSLWLFALTYLILMTIASKKSIRYMLPAFPAFHLLAGLAFYQIFSWNDGRSEGRKIVLAASRPFNWLFIFLIFLSISFAAVYHPYYLTYYNPALLGWRWAPQTILVGWGEGLERAADYLNKQPGSTVSAWYEWLFPIFYQGQVEAVVPQENLITADHAVLYINQVQRDIPNPNIVHYFRTRRRPEYTVSLAGIDYAWVYPGPIAGANRPDPAPQYPFGGDFGGEARLLGYDLYPQPRSGESLIVTLYWRILARPPVERFVYLRLVDGQGHIWAAADSPPVMGLWPADRWQPTMLIEDAHELSIPAGTPPGTYRIEAGLYEPASGQVLAATGQPVGQGGGLLLGEIYVEWQSLAVGSDLPRQTDTRLAANARLIGYTPPSTTATTGDFLPIQLNWRESATFLSLWLKPYNDLVMFEWRPTAARAPGPPLAEQPDPLPLPIDAWGRAALLRSQHDVIVPPALANGRYNLWLMLHDGSEPAGAPFLLGTVDVTSPAHQFDLPSTATSPTGPARLEASIALAGYEFHRLDSALSLNLYWRTDAPMMTRYKIFAQLLAADNTLVAQSDSFPAAGQRPTTGWLPGEIISDPHTLVLPPDPVPGSYRLIAGLYNPLTGERLPLLDEHGNPVADAIFIAEVTVP